MEEIIAVAPGFVGRANPDGLAEGRVGVGVPGHVKVAAQTELAGDGHVPAGISIQNGPCSFSGQIIIMVGGVQLHSQAPLTKIVQANNTVGFGFGFVQGGQKEGSENGDDRNDNEQFDEREALRFRQAMTAANRRPRVLTRSESN